MPQNALEASKYNKTTALLAILPADIACPHQFMRTTVRKKNDMHMKNLASTPILTDRQMPDHAPLLKVYTHVRVASRIWCRSYEPGPEIERERLFFAVFFS
jgi:hypothetical protein